MRWQLAKSIPSASATKTALKGLHALARLVSGVDFEQPPTDMSFLNPLLRESQAAVRLMNPRNGCLLAAHVRTAFDSKSRRQGLLGIDGLEPQSALIIAPTNLIHTWFMRFPIDVAFVARDGRVVKVRRDLQPWRVSGALGGYAVIELPAGVLAATDTLPGDVVSLEL